MGQALTSRDIEVIGGLAFMRILIEWGSVEFYVPLKRRDWQSAIQDVQTDLVSRRPGRYFVSLAREDEMTDECMYVNIRFEDEVSGRRFAQLHELVYVPGQAPQYPGPTPQWLLDVSKK